MKLVMRAQWFSTALLPWLLLTLLRAAAAHKDPGLKCGACLAMVDEMDHAISSADPKKTIQVGSFRVDSHGNQNLREIPYARSEVHLVEQFESVCNGMNNYAESDTDKGKVYMRTSSYDGSPISMKKATISGDVHKKLKYACEGIVEEYEEEMTELYKKSSENSHEHICVEVAGLCTKSDIEHRMWVLAEAVMAAMQEPTAEAEDAEDEDDDNDDDDDEEEEEEDEDEDVAEEQPEASEDTLGDTPDEIQEESIDTKEEL